jgi:putative cofactor-binding repeat protein
MNSATINTLKKEGKTGLTVLVVILILLSAVLFLQSIKYVSSLWVILQYGHELWWEDLWRMLKSLRVWAALTGVLFALEFAAHPAAVDLKRKLSGIVTGFLTGFFTPYSLVLAAGILIFLPLGILSLLSRSVIEYATLEFAWLVAAYLMFLWIAIDTPTLLLDMIKTGSPYIKFMAALLLLYLGVQMLGAIASGFSILVRHSIWHTSNAAFILAIFVSLLATGIASISTIGRQPLITSVFAVVGIYLASVVTGNVSDLLFHWGEMPSALVAAFVGPVLYSQAAKAILRNGIDAVAGIIGMVLGLVAGLLIGQLMNIRIIVWNWIGISIVTGFALVFGIMFGLMYGWLIITLLVSRTRLKPEIALRLGTGVLFGVVIGMVLGAFAGR